MFLRCLFNDNKESVELILKHPRQLIDDQLLKMVATARNSHYILKAVVTLKVQSRIPFDTARQCDSVIDGRTYIWDSLLAAKDASKCEFQ